MAFHLAYHPPYDWPAMLRHLAARAIAGVEAVGDGAYRRTFIDGGAVGRVIVRDEPTLYRLSVTASLQHVGGPDPIVERARRLFDIDADVTAITRHLAADALLAPLVAERPGLRVPGAWDGFELAVRAVLGQQVTLVAGRRLAERLVALCGRPVGAAVDGLSHVFPDPERVLGADLGALGMPAARRATLRAVAQAAVEEPGLFDVGGSDVDCVPRLRAIRGIGEWTAQYIALRALRQADAFPSGDAALVRAVATLSGVRPSGPELLARAEAWRPFRAYAAQHLWSAGA